MQLKFKRVTSNDALSMKDVLHIMDVQSRFDVGHPGPVGVKFHPGEFFVVSYYKNNPAGLLWCQAYPSPRKRIEVYQYITHPLLRNRRMPLYLTRYLTSWAARHGYGRVIIPNVIRRMQIILDHMNKSPRLIYSKEKKPRRAESYVRKMEHVTIRVRPRNSRKKSRPH